MTEMEPRTRWSEVSGGPGAATAYQQRFDDLAAKGLDIHGEAAFVTSLMSPPVRVLDAGCGTGRVAIQLTALGYHCTGVDADAAMIEVAQERDPSTTWVRQDLSRLQLRAQAFEIAVLAGNVIPLLAPGTLLSTVERIAAHLQPGGLLVAGFGLDAAHLPQGCPVTPLVDYDRACEVTGLSFVRRYATWDRQAWHSGGGYAVSVHRLDD
jgi:predicted TPR repeat methyltransferase